MQLSSDFDYLQELAAKYGTLYLAEEFDEFLESMNEQQLGELQNAYDMIERKEDAFRISRWMDLCLPLTNNVTYQERRFAQHVGSLLNLFRFLANKNIFPFATRNVRYIEQRKKPDWNNLPLDFHYLKEPAERYGIYGSESDIRKFLDKASQEDMDVLSRAAENIHLKNHMDVIDEWLNRYPINEHEEAWLVHCLLGILDHSGLL